MSERKLHFETLQLHVGQEQADPVTDSRAVPIYQTTSYVFQNCRSTPLTVSVCRCRQHLRPPDQHRPRMSLKSALPLSRAALPPWPSPPAQPPSPTPSRHSPRPATISSPQKTIYGGTYNLLRAHPPRTSASTTTFVNAHDLAESFESAIQPNTTRHLSWRRWATPTPTFIDIDAIAEIAHKHGIPLVVDNTFAHSLPASVRSSTARTSLSTRPPSSSAATARRWAASSSTAASSTGRRSGKFPASARRPTPATTASVFTEAAGPAAFVT